MAERQSQFSHSSPTSRLDETRLEITAHAMKLPLTLFFCGVGAGVACAGTAYLSQTFFSRFRHKTGIALQCLSALLSATGLAAFIVGALKAADGFANVFPSS